MKKSLIVLSLGIIILAGCKTSTSPGSSTGASITAPNAGSYFTIVQTQMDSTGAVVSIDTETETFEQTGFTIGGKTNVDKLVDTYSDMSHAPDSGYIHYESDGDVSVYAPGDTIRSAFGWFTYPFGTQGTTTVTIDTTIFGASTHMVLTITGAGTGSTTIKGQSYSTEKVTGHINAISTFSIGGYSYSDTINSPMGTISFAPSLGDVIEENDPGTRDPSTGMMGTSSHSIAVNFLLK